MEAAVTATSKGEAPNCATLAPLEQSTREVLERESVRAAQRQNSVAQRAIAAMSDFRSHYPHETVDFDVSIASAGEYRELHRRVADDDLPRFEKEFKDYLNQNTIRDIASFAAQLNKQEKLIRERIETADAIHPPGTPTLDCHRRCRKSTSSSLTFPPSASLTTHRVAIRGCSR